MRVKNRAGEWIEVRKMDHKGKIQVGSSQSLVASSQMATTTSQQTPRMRKQMAMVLKQLVAFRTTMSSAVQVCGVTSMGSGEGPPRQSSSN